MATNNPFYQFWSRPDKSEHILLADAHDWFQRFFPGSNPRLVKEENYNTLQATLRMPFSLAIDAGELRPVGQIRFLAQIHIKAGFIGLRFKDFEHLGGDGIRGIGPLAKGHPGDHPSITAHQWKLLKQQFATRMGTYFDTFLN